ncbi:MAG: hypothetical protein IKT52_09860 [Oscillospiraceae bacterium]|nr:hypothetical protein [Oscillospiraceae bacterium]
MVIGILGESCVGKSTLADKLKDRLGAEVFTGKDYLRLAKSEAVAKKLFQKKLEQAVSGENIVYVITEREHLSLLPDGAVRVLMTADLELILERFALRMRGNLPDPVKAMLQKKHGCFDAEHCDYHIHNNAETDAVCDAVLQNRGERR